MDNYFFDDSAVTLRALSQYVKDEWRCAYKSTRRSLVAVELEALSQEVVVGLLAVSVAG